MRLETKATSGLEHDHPLITPTRRRIRTSQGRLHRKAMRRNFKANTMMALSCVAVLALVRLFYEVLSR
jgi:hypothetical protein